MPSRAKVPELDVNLNGPAVVLFIVFLFIGLSISALAENPIPGIVGALTGLYFLFSVKVIRQWEKVALMRLGKYRGLRGPGTFFIIPVIDTMTPAVDQRVRVTSVTAESTLTRDTVPVNVDAAIFCWSGMRRRHCWRSRASTMQSP
ncbi:MAG: SPFH domain-containing protein [Acidobacteriota bacterium]